MLVVGRTHARPGRTANRPAQEGSAGARLVGSYYAASSISSPLAYLTAALTATTPNTSCFRRTANVLSTSVMRSETVESVQLQNQVS